MDNNKKNGNWLKELLEEFKLSLVLDEEQIQYSL